MGDEVKKNTDKDMQAVLKAMKNLEDYESAERIAEEIAVCFQHIMSLPKSYWLGRWKIEKGRRRFFYFGWWKLKLSREKPNQEDSTND